MYTFWMNKHFLFQSGLGFTQGEVGLDWNLPLYSLFLTPSVSFSSPKTKKTKKKKNSQPRAGFSVHLKTLKHTAKISHTYQIRERLCYTDFIGAYIKLIAKLYNCNRNTWFLLNHQCKQRISVSCREGKKHPGDGREIEENNVERRTGLFIYCEQAQKKKLSKASNCEDRKAPTATDKPSH